jgi:hypothetical protein
MPRNTFGLLLDSPSPSKVSFGFSSMSAWATSSAWWNTSAHSRRTQVWQKELAALFNPVLYRDDAFHRIEKELDWIEMASGQGAIDSP